MKALMSISILLLLVIETIAQAPSERFKKANALYQSKEYSEAITLYESVIEEGLTSADLHYNLGNAYFRSDELALAILHYEKALKIEPAMADAKHNLDFANSQTLDKIESPPKLFFYRWWDALIFACSCNLWSLISIGLLLVSVLMFATYLFVGNSSLKRFGFYASTIFFFLFIFTVFITDQNIHAQDRQDYAIILPPTVNINSSPSEGSSKLFVLHEGTKVKIGDQSGAWREVSLPNGNEGWVLSTDLGEI